MAFVFEEAAARAKHAALCKELEAQGKLCVAYSSGVDSTYLLQTAVETLGAENVLALTAKSCSFPRRELEEAVKFCTRRGIPHLVLETDELAIPGFAENPANRCYICKKALFQQFLAAAQQRGFAVLCEGSNMDDMGDYRPGMQAIAELKVCSPLRKVGLYKQEIRYLSQQMGLATAQKPSYACLASRFPYGEKITAQKLGMIEQAEQFLMDSGFAQMRVRIHGNVARIEVLPEDFDRLLEQRQTVVNALKGCGFAYVAMDLQGYRTGSMNETLPTQKA